MNNVANSTPSVNPVSDHNRPTLGKASVRFTLPGPTTPVDDINHTGPLLNHELLFLWRRLFPLIGRPNTTDTRANVLENITDSLEEIEHERAVQAIARMRTVRRSYRHGGNVIAFKRPRCNDGDHGA
jgi:hypothetical protein